MGLFDAQDGPGVGGRTKPHGKARAMRREDRLHFQPLRIEQFDIEALEGLHLLVGRQGRAVDSVVGRAQRAERESGYVAVMPAHSELVAAGR